MALPLSSTHVRLAKDLGSFDWLGIMFAVWLLLSVLTPEYVYRTFFHALIYPFTLFLLLRRGGWYQVRKDALLKVFLVFCLYSASATWFLRGGPEDNDAQATRWAAEAALGMLAFFFCAKSMFSRPRVWGYWFLAITVIGSVAGILSIKPGYFLEARAEGLGLLAHPIQGAAIASVFLAVGLFLMLSREKTSRPSDICLMLVALCVVWAYVLLTLSRGPMVALNAYLMALALVLYLRHRSMTAGGFVIAGVCACLLVLHWLVGIPQIVDQLISRGASYRMDIWLAYLNNPPESIAFGNGSGFDFRQTDAAISLRTSTGLDIYHPHNIWLGVFSETGLIGVLFQAVLLILPIVAIFRSGMLAHNKLHLLAILGLFTLLTFSDEFTLLISLHPVWLFGWLPLVFVWVWARYDKPEAGSGVHQGEAYRE